MKSSINFIYFILIIFAIVLCGIIVMGANQSNKIKSLNIRLSKLEPKPAAYKGSIVFYDDGSCKIEEGDGISGWEGEFDKNVCDNYLKNKAQP